jgi:hypothetical protein
MRKQHRVWIATLVVGLSLGGCLPCVPGVRVDAPRTTACAAQAEQCTAIATPAVPGRS